MPAARIGAHEETYGSVGSVMAPPAVPIAPEIDPPAVLDAPIDDVDGVVP
jgi:hypothetical protein